MKRLLNTLYITSGNRYLSLDGENVVVMEDKKEIGRITLHNLHPVRRHAAGRQRSGRDHHL